MSRNSSYAYRVSFSVFFFYNKEDKIANLIVPNRYMKIQYPRPVGSGRRLMSYDSKSSNSDTRSKESLCQLKDNRCRKTDYRRQFNDYPSRSSYSPSRFNDSNSHSTDSHCRLVCSACRLKGNDNTTAEVVTENNMLFYTKISLLSYTYCYRKSNTYYNYNFIMNRNTKMMYSYFSFLLV